MMKKEIIFFITIGIILNTSMLLLYIVLLGFKLDSKFVITIIYFFNLLISFICNKKFTFSSDGEGWKKLKRFFLLYLSMYILNIFVLYLFVDQLLMRPEIIQGALFVIYVPVVFVLQRYWVFPKTA